CRAKHINYSFNEEIEDPKQNLNSQVRENIYLIFKEAINNSVKHSQADHLSLDIKARKNGIKLVLIDNGVKKEAKQSLRKANGLENMKLRSKQIGAALTIDMDAGTRVELTMSMN
ncbi:MAG: hypothetical protein KDD94_13315, partial [Calditrichaeota bacterium]|nr:hypothetical protein [Calditrichota bacterium]